MIKGLLGRKERKFSKVKVTVTYEVEYDGHVTEDDIDISDQLKSPDNIVGIGKVKVRKMKALQ